MLLKILSSGSSGNCSVLTDKDNNQLIIDFGINYKQIAPHIIDFNKCACLLSHEHGDHNLSKKDFEFKCVDIYDHDNLESGKQTTINNVWKVLPIAVPHNVDCFAFIIYNIIENKKIFWATDFTELPIEGDNFNLYEEKFNFMAIECNYSEEIVFYKNAEGKLVNLGFINHHSLERLETWLSNRATKPNKLLITHLSNSEVLDLKMAKERFKPLCKELFVAKQNLEIII